MQYPPPFASLFVSQQCSIFLDAMNLSVRNKVHTFSCFKRAAVEEQTHFVKIAVDLNSINMIDSEVIVLFYFQIKQNATVRTQCDVTDIARSASLLGPCPHLSPLTLQSPHPLLTPLRTHLTGCS